MKKGLIFFIIFFGIVSIVEAIPGPGAKPNEALKVEFGFKVTFENNTDEPMFMELYYFNNPKDPEEKEIVFKGGIYAKTKYSPEETFVFGKYEVRWYTLIKKATIKKPYGMNTFETNPNIKKVLLKPIEKESK